MKKVAICIKVLIITITILVMFFINFIQKPVFAADSNIVTQQIKTGIENFPKTYQTFLKELKELHPNWNFEAYYTGIDWEELIKKETGQTLHTRSVVPSSKPATWFCKDCQNIRGWTCASSSAVEYFIDPRNFLNEVNIFQFEELSFNKNVHKLESIEKSVQNTFLKNSVTYYDEESKKNVTKTYSQIILEVAEKTNMSPFHIKSKIIQEVGSNGSASVSGTYEGYEGLYNFFNYGANDEGNPIANGLEFARQKGWTNPYKAILGGAQLIGSSYIGQGQNTSYFFKFDVVGNSILKATDGAKQISTTLCFSHQYMTNIMDPYSQSSSVYNMYASNGNLNASLNFIIPIYENMPDTNKKPTRFSDTEDLYYAKATLKIRNYANKTSEEVYTLEKDEVVKMIARQSTTADGVKWDRVELENGWNCWTESDGLICCKNSEDEEKESELIKLLIDNNNMQIKLTPSATIEDIIKEFNVKSYTILDSQNNTIKKEDEKLATGYKIKINDKTYTLIKLGDVNGDAEVDVIDLALIKRHLMETQKLTNSYCKAGLLQKEGTEIDVIDLALIKRVLIGTAKITV